jgi:hypothetical protein
MRSGAVKLEKSISTKGMMIVINGSFNATTTSQPTDLEVERNDDDD